MSRKAKLNTALIAVENALETEVTEEEYFQLLVSLKASINNYFEHTMVMVENEQLRTNRLSLLARVANVIKGFADVTEIIVK